MAKSSRPDFALRVAESGYENPDVWANEPSTGASSQGFESFQGQGGAAQAQTGYEAHEAGEILQPAEQPAFAGNNPGGGAAASSRSSGYGYDPHETGAVLDAPRATSLRTSSAGSGRGTGYDPHDLGAVADDAPRVSSLRASRASSASSRRGTGYDAHDPSGLVGDRAAASQLHAALDTCRESKGSDGYDAHSTTTSASSGPPPPPSSSSYPPPPSLRVSESAGGDYYHWANRFILALRLDTVQDRDKELRKLQADFLFAAETYGKLIIIEKFLRRDRKTIKPESRLGGIAGGVKFKVSGIIFKFALESEKPLRTPQGKTGERVSEEFLYPDDETASKSLLHDRKGAIAAYSVFRNKLRAKEELTSSRGMSISASDDAHGVLPLPPLMCLIDFRGFRLQAMCELPIKAQKYDVDKVTEYGTLISGTNDGGKHMAKTPKEHEQAVRSMYDELARSLNLQKHWAGIRNQTEVVGGADIEIHAVDWPKSGLRPSSKGSEDGDNDETKAAASTTVYFMVDTHRLSPPEVAADHHFFEPSKAWNERPYLLQDDYQKKLQKVGSGAKQVHVKLPSSTNRLTRLLRPSFVSELDSPVSPDCFSNFDGLKKKMLRKQDEQRQLQASLERDDGESKWAGSNRSLGGSSVRTDDDAREGSSNRSLELEEMRKDFRQLEKDKERNQEALCKAGDKLQESVRDFAAYLDKICGLHGKVMDLPTLLRAFGLNARHLGRVRKWTNNAAAKSALLCEIVARVLKNDMRHEFRRAMAKKGQEGRLQDALFASLALQSLQTIFGPGASHAPRSGPTGHHQRSRYNTENHYLGKGGVAAGGDNRPRKEVKGSIADAIERRFPNCLSDQSSYVAGEQRKTELDILAEIAKPNANDPREQRKWNKRLLERVQDMMSMKLSKDVEDGLIHRREISEITIHRHIEFSCRMKVVDVCVDDVQDSLMTAIDILQGRGPYYRSRLQSAMSSGVESAASDDGRRPSRERSSGDSSSTRSASASADESKVAALASSSTKSLWAIPRNALLRVRSSVKSNRAKSSSSLLSTEQSETTRDKSRKRNANTLVKLVDELDPSTIAWRGSSRLSMASYLDNRHAALPGKVRGNGWQGHGILFPDRHAVADYANVERVLDESKRLAVEGVRTRPHDFFIRFQLLQMTVLEGLIMFDLDALSHALEQFHLILVGRRKFLLSASGSTSSDIAAVSRMRADHCDGAGTSDDFGGECRGFVLALLEAVALKNSEIAMSLLDRLGHENLTMFGWPARAQVEEVGLIFQFARQLSELLENATNSSAVDNEKQMRWSAQKMLRSLEKSRLRIRRRTLCCSVKIDYLDVFFMFVFLLWIGQVIFVLGGAGKYQDGLVKACYDERLAPLGLEFDKLWVNIPSHEDGCNCTVMNSTGSQELNLYKQMCEVTDPITQSSTVKPITFVQCVSMPEDMSRIGLHIIAYIVLVGACYYSYLLMNFITSKIPRQWSKQRCVCWGLWYLISLLGFLFLVTYQTVLIFLREDPRGVRDLIKTRRMCNSTQGSYSWPTIHKYTEFVTYIWMPVWFVFFVRKAYDRCQCRPQIRCACAAFDVDQLNTPGPAAAANRFAAQTNRGGFRRRRFRSGSQVELQQHLLPNDHHPHP